MANEKVTLEDGSEVDADIFDNLESKLLDEGSSDFLENRFSKPKSDDPVTPFTAKPSPTVSNVAKKRHAERSDRAQHVDEEYNAPIAPDYETWQKQPNRYDLPGVDTIPKEKRDKRGRRTAQEAQEVGIVDEVKRESTPDNARGQFMSDNPKNLASGTTPNREIRAEPDLDEEYPRFQEGAVLGHETGHAIDFDVSPGEMFGSKGDFFEGRDVDLKDEAVNLSERMRGAISPGVEGYRMDERELVADAFASMAVEPRAAKREAPNLVDTLKTEFVDYVDDDDIFSF